MFLTLRLFGGFGIFPCWEWSPDGAATKSQLACVVQSVLQDIGNIGAFVELLFLAYILFSLKHDIFGLTFPIINRKHVQTRINISICVISVIGAVALLHMRNWCANGPVQEFYLHLIHFSFYGFAWLIDVIMFFGAGLLYFNNITQNRHNNNNNVRYINNGRTINETELNAATVGNNAKDIALNILFLSSCILVSTMCTGMANIYLFIKGINAPTPPLWFAILGQILLQSFPGLVCGMITFKCSKYGRIWVRDCWYKLKRYIDNCNCAIFKSNTDCGRLSDTSVTKPSFIDVDIEDISLSADVELVYDYTNNESNMQVSVVPYTIESSVINSNDGDGKYSYI